ncbi:MAG: hypothetical protein IJK23_06175 [Clostridia bacterium]|nr:hypothetical protein [Clostridia bacterium]
MKTARKKTVVALTVLSAILLIFFSAPAAEGVRSSLLLCTDTLIPSLFPFMIASSYLSGLLNTDEKGGVLSKTARRLFGLSEGARGLLFCALFGGYPVGARLAAQRAGSGRLSGTDRKVLSRLAFFPAPSFTVAAVGQKMFSSARTGFMICGCVLFAGIVCGAAFSFPRDKSEPHITPASLEQKKDLPGAVNDAAAGILGVCLWTVFFGAVRGVLTALMHTENALLTCVSEVSAGCLICAGKNDPALAAAVCAFGGFCVHLQIYTYLKRLGCRYRDFLLFRVFHSALSYLAARAATAVLPAAILTSSTLRNEIKPALTSGVGAVMLFFLCCLLVLDTAGSTTFLSGSRFGVAPE